MERQEFIILYTHQKTKKAKTWQDGILKTNGTQGILYDEKGSKLDALHLKPGQVALGEELESDRYLIQIEEVKAVNSPAVGPPSVNPAVQHHLRKYPSGPAGPPSYQERPSRPPQAPQGLRVGLKRKKSTFVPPRQLKQPRQDNLMHSNDAEDDQPITALQALRCKQNMNTEMPKSSGHNSDSSVGVTQDLFSLYSSEAKSGIHPTRDSNQASGSQYQHPHHSLSPADGHQGKNTISCLNESDGNSSQGIVDRAIVRDNRCEVNQSTAPCSNYSNNGLQFTSFSEHGDGTQWKHKTSTTGHSPVVGTITQSNEKNFDHIRSQISQTNTASTPPSPWSVVGQRMSPKLTNNGTHSVPTAAHSSNLSSKTNSGKRSTCQILALIGAQKKEKSDSQTSDFCPPMLDAVEVSAKENVAPHTTRFQQMHGENQIESENKDSPQITEAALTAHTHKRVHSSQSPLLPARRHTVYGNGQPSQSGEMNTTSANQDQSLDQSCPAATSQLSAKDLNEGGMSFPISKPQQVMDQIDILAQKSSKPLADISQSISQATSLPKPTSQQSLDSHASDVIDREINYSPLSHVSLSSDAMSYYTPDLENEKLQISQLTQQISTLEHSLSAQSSGNKEKVGLDSQMSMCSEASAHLRCDHESNIISKGSRVLSSEPEQKCDDKVGWELGNEADLSGRQDMRAVEQYSGSAQKSSVVQEQMVPHSNFRSNACDSADGEKVSDVNTVAAGSALSHDCDQVITGMKDNGNSPSSLLHEEEIITSKLDLSGKEQNMSDNFSESDTLGSRLSLSGKINEDEDNHIIGLNSESNLFVSSSSHSDTGIDNATTMKPNTDTELVTSENIIQQQESEEIVAHICSQSRDTSLDSENTVRSLVPPRSAQLSSCKADGSCKADDSSMAENEPKVPVLECVDRDETSLLKQKAEVPGFDIVLADWSDEDWDVPDEEVMAGTDSHPENGAPHSGMKLAASEELGPEHSTVNPMDSPDKPSQCGPSSGDPPVAPISSSDCKESIEHSLMNADLVKSDLQESQIVASTLSTSDTMNTLSQSTELTDSNCDTDNDDLILYPGVLKATGHSFNMSRNKSEQNITDVSEHSEWMKKDDANLIPKSLNSHEYESELSQTLKDENRSSCEVLSNAGGQTATEYDQHSVNRKHHFPGVISLQNEEPADLLENAPGFIQQEKQSSLSPIAFSEEHPLRVADRSCQQDFLASNSVSPQPLHPYSTSTTSDWRENPPAFGCRSEPNQDDDLNSLHDPDDIGRLTLLRSFKQHSVMLSNKHETKSDPLLMVKTMREDPLETGEDMHPSLLMRERQTPIGSPQPMEAPADIASIASLKLDGYKLQGIMASQIVRRDNVQHSVCEDGGINPSQAVKPDRHGGGLKSAVLQHSSPVTPQFQNPGYEGASLYDADFLHMREKYDHHHVFGMATPASLQRRMHSPVSTSQCVPQSGFHPSRCDSPKMELQVVDSRASTQHNERKMLKRKPMRCQPFDDEVPSEKSIAVPFDSSQCVPKIDILSSTVNGQATSRMSTEVSVIEPSCATVQNYAMQISRGISGSRHSIPTPSSQRGRKDCAGNMFVIAPATPDKMDGRLAWMDNSPGDLSISDSPVAMPEPMSRQISSFQARLRPAAHVVPPCSSSSITRTSSLRSAVSISHSPSLTSAASSINSTVCPKKSNSGLSNQPWDITHDQDCRKMLPNLYRNGQHISDHKQQICDNDTNIYSRDVLVPSHHGHDRYSGVGRNISSSIDSENPFGSSAGSRDQMTSQNPGLRAKWSGAGVSEWDSPVADTGVGESLEAGFSDGDDIGDAECMAALEQLPTGASKWERFSIMEEEKVNPAELHYHGRFSPLTSVQKIASNTNIGKMDNLKSEMNFTSTFSKNKYTDAHHLPSHPGAQDSFLSHGQSWDPDTCNSATSSHVSPTIQMSAVNSIQQPLMVESPSSVMEDRDVCGQQTAGSRGSIRSGLSKAFKTPRMRDQNMNKMASSSPSYRSISRAPSFEVPQSNPKQVTSSSILRFPDNSEVESVTTSRQIVIPTEFRTPADYKSTIIAALREHLNVQLCELSKALHSAAAKVDMAEYSESLLGGYSVRGTSSAGKAASSNPPCEHGAPAKMVQVKKDGPNKGRFFFTCGGMRNAQCKFFQWADDSSGGKSHKSCAKMTLSDARTVMTYFKGQNVPFYCECQLIRKVADSYNKNKTIPHWVKKRMGMITEDEGKKRLYLKLPFKENHNAYAKDDLWVISQSLEFDPGMTFIAKSAFYGPNSNTEVEITPLSGYFPSNWPNNVLCHAIHAGNATTELGCIDNLETLVNSSTLPILPYLLSRQPSSCSSAKGFTAPKMQEKQICFVPRNTVSHIAENYVEKYHLNVDQAHALRDVATMFFQDSDVSSAISLIHGVFGAGKSYLLAVIVMFLVELFEVNESYTPGVPEQLRLLISSNTNVAVDRILLGLLDLGFEEFVRVGSMKKIAKPVLPYSVHAAGSASQELRDLQDMLKSSDITPEEKTHVRRSIEQQRRGENKKKLSRVRVVGVTCAASVFQCLKDFVFPVVLLDECSQMTEPTSLLPIARFQCQKLVLVGDPKQLDPTISGAASDHKQGLEQTLFDRLSNMGHVATILRTQYRCHPVISAIANDLFYDGQLQDGIKADDRPSLVFGWPALCFFDVPGGQEQSNASGSYSNEQEAYIVVEMVRALVSAGVEPTAIGVCTLYKAQSAVVVKNLYQQSELRGVQVSTVDAFQGGERGVIILSCVRTHYVGFIDCQKRINVALTRAKNHLLIVGHLRNLEKNPLWARVIQHCKRLPDGLQNGPTFIRELQQSQQVEQQPAEKQCQKTGTHLKNSSMRECQSDKSWPVEDPQLADYPDSGDHHPVMNPSYQPEMQQVTSVDGYRGDVEEDKSDVESVIVRQPRRAKVPQIVVAETDFQTSHIDSDDSNDDDLIPF